MDSEVKRSKRELSEYEARNRELGAQVEAVRQQAAQIQEEAQAMKEASLLEKRAHEDMKRLTTIPSKTKKAAAAAKKDFTAAVDEALKTDVLSELSLESAKDAATLTRCDPVKPCIASGRSTTLVWINCGSGTIWTITRLWSGRS